MGTCPKEFNKKQGRARDSLFLRIDETQNGPWLVLESKPDKASCQPCRLISVDFTRSPARTKKFTKDYKQFGRSVPPGRSAVAPFSALDARTISQLKFPAPVPRQSALLPVLQHASRRSAVRALITGSSLVVLRARATTASLAS